MIVYNYDADLEVSDTCVRMHDAGVRVSPGLKSTYDGRTSDYAGMHDADLALVRVASPGVG